MKLTRERFEKTMAEILGNEVIVEHVGFVEGAKLCAVVLFKQEEVDSVRAKEVRKVLSDLEEKGEIEFD